MLKRVIPLLMAVVSIWLLTGCQTDYTGTEKQNVAPKLSLSFTVDTDTIRTRKAYKVFWHGNDIDSYNVTYFYTTSTDTNLKADNVMQNHNLVWKSTRDSYAEISFPYLGAQVYRDYSTTYYDTTFISPGVVGTITPRTVPLKYGLSKLFLYAMDDSGNRTDIVTRSFWRTNIKPALDWIRCEKFGWETNEDPSLNWNIASKYQVLTSPYAFIPGDSVQFNCQASDSDGSDVKLQFKWLLYKLKEDGSVAPNLTNIADSSIYLHIGADKIYETAWRERKDFYIDSLMRVAGRGYYKLKLVVKDDADEECKQPVWSVFKAIKPMFDRGVLVLNKTTEFKDPLNYKYGNPDYQTIGNFYQQLFTDLGYHSPTSKADLKSYEILNYPVPDANFAPADNKVDLYPNIETLLRYRLLIIVAENRKPSKVFLQDNSKNAFGKELKKYLDLGGKVMVVGNNVLAEMLAADDYAKPISQTNTEINEFKKVYLGISSVTTGEGYEKKSNKDFFHDYDFIGVKPYTHIEDTLYSMRVDSHRVNLWWKMLSGKTEYIVKGNGMFLPGVATLRPFKGEIILGYESVYQHPDASISANPAYVKNYSGSDVLNRNLFDGLNPGYYSAVATRYVAPNDLYRTAVIGVPLYFMDDKEGAVSKNMAAMLKWFKLGVTPQSVTKK